jgi:hypothetical protein
MYRIEDLEKIKANLDKIQDDAANEYKKNNEPNLEEIGKVYSAIKDFIKRKKKIAYGGFSQNLLLLAKNSKEAIYKEVDGAYYNWPDLADIEFYSPTPIQDMIDLLEELHAKGFKYVEGAEAAHPETYKIFINFLNYCDISYMPLHVYNNLPYIEINGIRCVHPHFMMVDAYRILTDPMTSYWRLDKPLKRFPKLLKYYPLETKNKMNFDVNTNKDVMKYIRKKLLMKSKLIVIGFYAYNYYAKKNDANDMIKDLPFFEAISTDFHSDARHIYRHLVHKYKSDITVKEFVPFITFTDHRVEYYYKGVLVFRLYGNNMRCTVYSYSDKKKIHFGTYNLVYMYMLFSYYYAYINRNKKDTDNYMAMLVHFNKVRNDYLNSHNITVVDISPFQDFTMKCFGLPVDSLRESRIEGAKNKTKKFRYHPSGKPAKAPNYNFSNTSGNVIVNNMNLVIKK